MVKNETQTENTVSTAPAIPRPRCRRCPPALQKALDSERFIVFVAYAEDGQLHFGEHRHAFPTGDLNALAKKIDAEIEAAWLSASPAPIGKGR